LQYPPEEANFRFPCGTGNGGYEGGGKGSKSLEAQVFSNLFLRQDISTRLKSTKHANLVS